MPFDDTSIAADSVILARLKEARHRIRIPQLWCKETIQTRGRRCMIGAFPTLKQNIWMDVQRLLIEHIPSRYNAIQHFNDAPETRHADVLAVFDAAIAELESK